MSARKTMISMQLDSDVERLLLAVCKGKEFTPDEVLNKTMRIWFHIMALCADDPQADSMFQQLIDKAAARASVSGDSGLLH